MGELDRIRQIGPGPTVTPRIGEGGQRRPRQDERETPRDQVVLHLEEAEPEPGTDAPENPVEEPYRLDIAV